MPHSRLPSPAPEPAVNTRWWERSSAETGPGLCIRERRTVGRMDGRTDGRTGERTDGRTDKTGPRVCGTYITCSITAWLLTISRVSLSLPARARVNMCMCVGALAIHRRRDERANPNRPHTTARNHSKPSVNTRGDERRGRGRVGLSEQQRTG